MSNTNPSQNPDPNAYGGYGGYAPQQPIERNPNIPLYPTLDMDTQNVTPSSVGQQQVYQAPASASQQQQQMYQPPASVGQQQQQFYQPPASVLGKARAYNYAETSSMKMDAKKAAALSYLTLFVGALFFLIRERQNRFVRFHAAQSFVFTGIAFLIYALVRVLTLVPIIGGLISGFAFLIGPLVGSAFLIVLVFLIVQAYFGFSVKLPIFGDYAERLLKGFRRKKKSQTI